MKYIWISEHLNKTREGLEVNGLNTSIPVEQQHTFDNKASLEQNRSVQLLFFGRYGEHFRIIVTAMAL